LGFRVFTHFGSAKDPVYRYIQISLKLKENPVAYWVFFVTAPAHDMLDVAMQVGALENKSIGSTLRPERALQHCK